MRTGTGTACRGGRRRLAMLAAAAAVACGWAVTAAEPIAAGCRLADGHTLVGEKDFLRGHEPVNGDGTINVVVEIPTGTTAKWEVRESGRMIRDFKDGKPRVVKYLGYPGNYGMIPRTRSGDGDALDAIVLGPARPRGSVVRAKLVGVLRFLDDGEADDKLLAVLPEDPLGTAEDVKDLTGGKFVNVVEIVRLWFESYKGPGSMVFRGVGDRAEAWAGLDRAIAAFGETPK